MIDVLVAGIMIGFLSSVVVFLSFTLIVRKMKGLDQ